MDISEEKSFELRKKIGDDLNRVALDMSSPKRCKQILFSEKVVTCKGFILASSCNRAGIGVNGRDLKKCPICGHMIGISVDYRTAEKNIVEIMHKGNFPNCVLKPRKRIF